MPWEISVLAAGVSLLILAAAAAVTAADIRRTGRRAAELGAVLDRHVPAIRQNLEELAGMGGLFIILADGIQRAVNHIAQHRCF